MGKKGDLSNFERGMVVGVRVFHKSAQLLGFKNFCSLFFSLSLFKKKSSPELDS